MRRSLIVLTAIAVTGAIAAPAASAAPACSAPSQLTWHSCLSAGHRAIEGTHKVVLTKATAIMVVRMAACPADLPTRRLVIRTESRHRVVKKRVEGTCKNNVGRWRLKVKPDMELPSGTVINSYWSGIADSDSAPSVQLGKKH
jgi:hypothetical protein